MIKRALILLCLIPTAFLQSGTISPEAVDSGRNIKNMIPTILAEHNLCRKASSKKLRNLEWDNNLAAFAQSYADKLMRKKPPGLKHSSHKDRLAISGWKEQWVGENLGYAMDSRWKLNTNIADLKTAVRQTIRSWCDEKHYYNYAKNTCKRGKACGHYTQVVWQETTKVGCGIAISKDGTKYILVCNYGPGGNLSGVKPYGGKRPAKGNP